MHQKVLVLLITLAVVVPSRTDATVQVVATLQDYAALAREVGGERVEVRAIVAGNSDPHFIKPKPSYALMLRDAELLIATGLDLELWLPVLLNKSGNRKIVEGASGFVAAAHGIELLQKPVSLSRTAGDVHIYGNPHIHTSPINAKIIARNIATGLCKVDPEGCPAYETNLRTFQETVSRRLYGDRLVELLGAPTLDALARKGELLSFLDQQEIADELGGWLREALPLRDRKLICYHKNWVYFATLFGLQVVDYVEPKPGIPPTARHVADLVRTIPAEDVKVLLSANYFERRKPQLIADRTGIQPVVVPLSVAGEEGVESYTELIELWITRLNKAFAEADAAG
ncbi:MAG: zinc ABC transporter substrate-binding protein [bacterium]|nr:zinc ABC transporter substrate-binding protein [bacterium]